MLGRLWGLLESSLLGQNQEESAHLPRDWEKEQKRQERKGEEGRAGDGKDSKKKKKRDITCIYNSGTEPTLIESDLKWVEQDNKWAQVDRLLRLHQENMEKMRIHRVTRLQAVIRSTSPPFIWMKPLCWRSAGAKAGSLSHRETVSLHCVAAKMKLFFFFLVFAEI